MSNVALFDGSRHNMLLMRFWQGLEIWDGTWNIINIIISLIFNSIYNIIAVHDHCQSLTVIGLLEGSRSTHQHVEDHTKTPNVWKEILFN